MWSNHYRYENGNLYRIYSNHNHAEGKKVGYIDKRGYVRTKLGGKMTFAHRIIWEMHFGAILPGMEIDHINGIRHENRIDNLRMVTRAVNCKNAAKRADNKSGFTGISFNNKKQAWIVQTQCDGVNFYKTCKSIDEAKSVCEAFYREYEQFTNRHGK